MDIFTAVVSRLAGFGYTVTSKDNASVRYNISKAEAKLKAETNQAKVPDALFYVWIDMAAGLFLTDKKLPAIWISFTISARRQRVFPRVIPLLPSQSLIPAPSRTSLTLCLRR